MQHLLLKLQPFQRDAEGRFWKNWEPVVFKKSPGHVRNPSWRCWINHFKRFGCDVDTNVEALDLAERMSLNSHFGLKCFCAVVAQTTHHQKQLLQKQNNLTLFSFLLIACWFGREKVNCNNVRVCNCAKFSHQVIVCRPCQCCLVLKGSWQIDLGSFHVADNHVMMCVFIFVFVLQSKTLGCQPLLGWHPVKQKMQRKTRGMEDLIFLPQKMPRENTRKESMMTTIWKKWEMVKDTMTPTQAIFIHQCCWSSFTWNCWRCL